MPIDIVINDTEDSFSVHLVTLVFALFLWAPAALTTLLYVPHYAEAHQDYTNNPQARLELFIAAMQSHAIQHHHPVSIC